MADLTAERQGQDRLDRLLLLAFGFSFSARLVERLVYVFHLGGRTLDFTTNYGLTEWLTNYAGGFQRRGLPGAFIHGLYVQWGVAPNASIVTACVILYAVFSVYLWRRSAGIVPRWVLLTTPLLGYPVFIDRILIRKDLLVLLLFALAVRLICSRRQPWHGFLAGLILAVGILSHEVIAFLAMPSFSALIVLRALAEGRSGVPPVVRRVTTSLTWLVLPLLSLAAVLLFRGTDYRVQAIAQSWRGAFDPDVPFPGPQGAIAWLSIPAEKYIADAQGVLAELHYGVPLWLIILLASVSGVVLLAAVIGRQSRIRAWFFVAAALLQFLFMAPVFFSAWDHGRWVILSLISAFILTIETPMSWQMTWASLSRFPPQLQAVVLPLWMAPAGFAFWGIQGVSWSAYGWLASAPVGLLLQAYFYLRTLGMGRPF
jgi:hypothetical protein